MKDIFEIQRPEPHPAKKLLEDAGVPMWRTARYLKISYFHCSKVLNGIVPVSKQLRRKLDKLIEHLKSREV